MKQTCLIAASVPGSPGVDGVFLRDMLDVPGITPVSLAAMQSNQKWLQTPLRHVDSTIAITPPNEWYTTERHNALTLPQRYCRHRFRFGKQLQQQLQHINTFIRQRDPEQLWVVLNSIGMIDLASMISDSFPGTLITQVWDDPIHLCKQRQIDRFNRSRTLSRFRQLLQRSSRIGVICEEAASSYEGQTNAAMHIVRHGLPGKSVGPRLESDHPGEFHIGFSGSLYAKDAWQSLHRALDSIDWQLAGRQVVLVVTGSQVQFRSKSTAKCLFYGWRNQDDLQRLLGSCDCLYLPQPFSAGQVELAKLSFPTKLSSYVATGRPVFVHSPQYSSVSRFCEEHSMGVVCQSLAPESVVSQLQSLACDSSYYRDQAESSARVANEVLSYDAFASGVRGMLGVSEVVS
ncbi:glycosyltransferase family 4 protein [Rhodopirellula sp. MGV]|uniref:glycosyltransferase family 4 protein n=1 Tax=Rhodopirellula sp. MGV TaxID=2023130 RepID=UPI001179C3CF|nr:glycosyltransferase family 4 protein [Rhodopirellula sp. MGV]